MGWSRWAALSVLLVCSAGCPERTSELGGYTVPPPDGIEIVCPVTKGPLRYDRDRNELVSERAGLAYPIRDGIPIMLPEDARPLTELSASSHRRGG